MAAEKLGLRVVCVRIGIVLASGGGALMRMLTPFKMGVGGRLGSGKQWMPWVHIDDVVGILLHASQHKALSGAINAVSPSPVTNAEFTRALAKTLHRPAVLPVPTAMLRLSYGEMTDMLLASQRLLPKAALETGVTFKYSNVLDALSDILNSDR